MPRSLQGGSTRTRSNVSPSAAASASGGADVDDRRAHPLRRSCAAPRRGPGASRRRRSRPRCPSARRGGWSCRRGRRTGPARARPARARARARRPSRRATAASAGRRRHSGAAKVSKGPSRISASSSTTVGGEALGQLGARSSCSVLARSDASAGSLSAAIRALRRLGAERRPTTAARSTPGASASARPAPAWRRAARRRCARASRTARRRTALTSPAPLGASRLGQLDRLADRGVRGDAVEEGQLKDPEPQRGEHRRVELGDAALRVRRSITWSSVATRWTVPKLSWVASARSRASSRRRLRFAVQRAVRPRVLLEHAAHHGVGASPRRGEWGRGLMEGPGFARQPLRSPGHLIGSRFRSAPGLAICGALIQRSRFRFFPQV